MPEAVVLDMKMNGAKGSDGGGTDAPSSLSSEKKNSRRPKYSKFTQQELPACKPILTPGLVIATLLVIGIVCIPIGLLSALASQSVVEIVDRYDGDCVPGIFADNKVEYIKSSETDKTCVRTLTVPKHMKAPVFVYYELDNFFQNHRRYVRSRSDKQLMSKSNDNSVDSCKPEQGQEGKPIVPCGLIAWSMFNDTYKFSKKNMPLQVNKKNIAWSSDKEHKFGSDVYPKNFQTGGLIGGAKLNESVPLSEQEDLMVWMRTAALPKFRKLYGKIEEDLQANEVIEVKIQNNYNSYGYGGRKSLVLSTTSWLGGKNNFLGVAYLSLGGLCLFMAITFILIYVFKPRPIGDPSYLSWNRHPSGHRM